MILRTENYGTYTTWRRVCVQAFAPLVSSSTDSLPRSNLCTVTKSHEARHLIGAAETSHHHVREYHVGFSGTPVSLVADGGGWWWMVVGGGGWPRGWMMDGGMPKEGGCTEQEGRIPWNCRVIPYRHCDGTALGREERGGPPTPPHGR
jgi:hypothetical protein